MDRFGLFLKPYDQISLAVILVGCGLAMATYFLRMHHLHDQWIDVDSVEHQTAAYRVDINRADWPEIANIPGVGKKLAQAIVANREKLGPFEQTDHLNRVPGIGPSKRRSLEQYILPLGSNQSQDVGSLIHDLFYETCSTRRLTCNFN